jgi:hypothetical protein
MDGVEAGRATGRPLSERMIAAALLDIDTYEEVEHDTTATGQAAIVVGMVALCAALGDIGHGGQGAISALLSAYVGWLIWAGVTYVIGEKILGGTATWGELLRTLGFAQAPGVFLVAGVVPVLGALVKVVVVVWLLVTGVVAIRQALDFSTGKALLTAFLGMMSYIMVALFFAVILGVGVGIGVLLR